MERCIELDISWITAPLPTSSGAFTDNLDNGINNLIKSAYKKVRRTASILMADRIQNKQTGEAIWKMTQTEQEVTSSIAFS